MKQRIITAIVAIACFVPILWFSEHLYVWLPACALLAFVGIYEMQKCIGTLHLYPLSGLSFVFCGGLLALCAFAPQSYPTYAYAAVMGLLLLSFFVSVFSRGKIGVQRAVMSAMTTVYLSVAFASFVGVRYAPQGQYFYLLMFFLPWVTDTAAYFCGVTLGRHKLIPDVSPKKSVEGAIGGVLFAVAFTMGFLFVVQRCFGGFANANYLVWGLSGALLSILSQCGDLVASLVKRQYQIKDYGNLFPGHGGVLDRFDSVLPCAVCLYFLLLLGVL